MGLFVKNNYLRLLIALFLIWVFSSCASSENTVEKLEENQKVKEETPEVFNGWIQIGSQKFEMVFTCYKTKLGEVAAIGNGDCLLYTSPSPRDGLLSRMPSSA